MTLSLAPPSGYVSFVSSQIEAKSEIPTHSTHQTLLFTLLADRGLDWLSWRQRYSRICNKCLSTKAWDLCFRGPGPEPSRSGTQKCGLRPLLPRSLGHERSGLGLNMGPGPLFYRKSQDFRTHPRRATLRSSNPHQNRCTSEGETPRGGFTG